MLLALLCYAIFAFGFVYQFHFCVCFVETLEPDVKILSLSIVSPERPDLVLPIPDDGNPKGLWFTLKEGSRYNLKFSFQVANNIVAGLKYTNTVWKTGVKGIYLCLIFAIRF